MNALLLLMGGSGERFGSSTPKQFLKVEFEGVKRPLFEITARKILAALPIDIVIFVSPKNTMGTSVVSPVIERLMADFPGRKMQYAAAGATRYGSFGNGLAAAAKFDGLERVLVHDANRPYLKVAFLERVASHMSWLSEESPCFIPVAPVVDSIVRVDGTNVVHYENRLELKRVQTPQLIHYPSFEDKFSAAVNANRLAMDFTDEGSLCLSLGMPVGSFEGDTENVKITFPEDLIPGKL
jgi:2-C-methyl-D-erythritol 4-phosphate cytidylyltransferase